MPRSLAPIVTTKKVPMSFARTFTLAAVSFGLLTTACSGGGSDSSPDAAADTTTTVLSNPDAGDPEGPGCGADVGDVSDDPVTDAVAANPALATMADAVGIAGLADTLEQADSMTVFAPTNNAFAAIPADQLDAILADQDQLTAILTYHVVPQAIAPEDLGATYTTANGADLTVTGDAPGFEVGSGGARVVCSGVQTENATVYLIDSVLLPPG